MADPGERSLDDPAFGEHDEAMQFIALDNRELPSAGLGDGGRGLRTLVRGIREDTLECRIATALCSSSIGAHAASFPSLKSTSLPDHEAPLCLPATTRFNAGPLVLCSLANFKVAEAPST